MGKKKGSPNQGKVHSPLGMTKHHMVPRCRFSSRDGTHTKNTRRVQRQVHEAWHRLFGIMTPFEVVAYIVTVLAPRGYFVEVHFTARWDGADYQFDLSAPKRADPILAVKRQFRPVDWNLVFGGTVTWISAAEQVVKQWSPPGYFRSAHVIASPEERYSFSCGEDAPA